MKRAILYGILLSSCVPQPAPTCFTECGEYYYGIYPSKEDRPGWTCEAISLAERTTLQALTKTSDPRLQSYDASCAALKHWSLWLNSDPSWEDMYHRSVAGITTCDYWITEVGYQPDASIMISSFPHELVHVLQRCYAMPDGGVGQDWSHANWRDTGISSTLDQIQVP